MTTDPVLLSIEDNIATVTLNRPDALNALTTPMVEMLRDTLADLRNRDDVRALVLTGSGRAFCAGVDLKDPMMSREAERSERGGSFRKVMDTMMNVLMRDLYNFDRPKIAAVNGPAVGGGIGLSLVMDVVVAARSAYFSQVFASNLNLIPDLGCTWLYARQLGRARAVGLAMTGDRLSAETAEEWGLIWRCVDDDALAETVDGLARKFSTGPFRALSATPKLFDAAAINSFSDQLDQERDAQVPLLGTEDFEEAVTAFREKRKPVFTGR